MADIAIARTGAVELPRPAQKAAWLVAAIGMMLALLAPALWNGFAIIFPDTGGYLARPIEGTLALGRSALYGWLLYIGMPLAFWPVIVAQAAATVWIITLTLRCYGLARPWLALGVTVALALLTSLPWFSAQLMPDIFFPLAVLALHLLVFRAAALNSAERCGLAAVIALAIASHMAALALCLGMLVALRLLAFVKPLGLPSPRLRDASLAAVAGVALCLSSNAVLTGVVGFTPGGPSFLFGRLIEDGIVQRYLHDRCPDPTLRVCAYAKQIPEGADDWLWRNDTPFYKLGGVAGFEPEAKRIIVGSLKLYPMMHLETALAATLEQFTSFQTEISTDDNDPTFDAVRDYAPWLLPAYQAARQQAQGFDVAPLNLVHVPVAGLSIAGLVLALALRRRLKIGPEWVALCAVVLTALAINAAVCGVFSHPVDRYQSRLVLLAPLALAMLVIHRRRGHLRLEAAPG